MKSLLQLLCAIVSLVLLAGCATDSNKKATDYPYHLAVHYTAQQNVVPVTGADHVTIGVKLVDARIVRDRVGQMNDLADYNEDDHAGIAATNDVVQVLQKALEDEAANRGFKISTSDGTLVVQLNTFYADLKATPWFTTRGFGLLDFNAKVVTSDGTILYSKQFTGHGRQDGFNWFPSTSTYAASALNRSLKDGVAKLFDDPAFIRALLKTSAP